MNEVDILRRRAALLAKGHIVRISFSKNRELYGTTSLWLWEHFGPRDVLWYSSTETDHVLYSFSTADQAFEFKMNFG